MNYRYIWRDRMNYGYIWKEQIYELGVHMEGTNEFGERLIEIP